LEQNNTFTNFNIEKKQSRISDVIYSISTPIGKAQPNHYWCSEPSEIEYYSTTGAQYIKEILIERIPTFWHRVIVEPQLATCFFPFIRTGLENMCNALKNKN